MCSDCFVSSHIKKVPRAYQSARCESKVTGRQLRYYYAHLDKIRPLARVRNRNKYRLERGIPLNAPLVKPGRPRKPLNKCDGTATNAT